MNGTAALPAGDLPASLKPRLLLAADDPTVTAHLRELLASEYEVEATANGEEAWTALAGPLPDLVLADVEMPLLGGVDLLRRLRADARTAGVVLILMSADHQQELLLEALAAGMDEVVFIPLRPLELLVRLRGQRRTVALRREASEHLARREAETVAQAKHRFFAALNHELRTPLTPVKIALQLIARTEGLPAPVYESVETIARNVEAQAALVADLLDVSQIVDGRLDVSLMAIDLHDCLGQAIHECRGGLASKGLRFTLDLSARCPEVMGDAERLRQVFCRLLRNAGEFTPEQGAVHVRSFNLDGATVVEVQDNGAGIADELLPQLFEAFRRGTPPDTGLGIGLAISHAIVTAHEGQLTAHSPGLDRGATFRVSMGTRIIDATQRDSEVQRVRIAAQARGQTDIVYRDTGSPSGPEPAETRQAPPENTGPDLVEQGRRLRQESQRTLAQARTAIEAAGVQVDRAKELLTALQAERTAATS